MSAKNTIPGVGDKKMDSRHLAIAMLLAAGVASQQAAAVQVVAGITFEDNAFADRIMSTDFTGLYSACNGYSASSLDEALLGANLNTWFDYGYHDMVPGDDGDYNSAAPPNQYIELGFTDNLIVNGPGADLVIFELGTPNSIRVALDKNSIQNAFEPGSIALDVSAAYLPVRQYSACDSVTAAYVDLSELGVAEGDSVYRVFISSPLMENGDVAWYNPLYPQLGVPEIAAVGAINTTPKGNYAPIVQAGADIIISQPANTVNLQGYVNDDGLPAETLTRQWSRLSGPTVQFANANNAQTVATLNSVGTYVLRLQASDGELTANDTVTVTVTAPDNAAPSAPASLSASLIQPSGVRLQWPAATDNVAVSRYNIFRDGLQIGSTTNTDFKDFKVTPATTYGYYVVAEDPAGNLSPASDTAIITLAEPMRVFQIASGGDDAEEYANGTVSVTDTDLELVNDGTSRGNQRVGLRFPAINLPKGAQIINAYIQFETDETGTAATNLQIRGFAQDATAAFTTAAQNISSRPVTQSAVSWADVSAWNKLDEKHNTPNLAPIVQEVIDRAGWQTGNAIGFVLTGTGRRTAEAHNGEAAAAAKLFIQYSGGQPTNQSPTANAGADITLTLPNDTVNLSGQVADDGLPGTGLTSTWSQVSGPTTAQFANSASPATSVTFLAAGTYVLRLQVSDGELTASDTVTVVVNAPDSVPPSVPANLTAIPSNNGTGSVALSWDAATDNVAVAGYRIFRDGVQITQVSGLSHADNGLVAYQQYTYQVRAVDQAGNVSSLSAPVQALIPGASDPVSTVNVRITSGNDDVEEADDGRMDLASSDLELAYEFGMGNQHVGLRFPAVQVPAGATITNAWIEFEVDETGSSATSLTVRALAENSAAAFTTAAFNLSNRPTTGSVSWSNLAAWNTLDAKQQTPNLAALVQALVNRPGWSQGNAMGFVITGMGTRTAESYNGEGPAAPLLHIEYTAGAPVNQAPLVNAGNDATLVLPTNSTTLNGSVTDDGLPGPTSLAWSQVSGPGTAVFANAANASTSVSFPAAGSYVLRLTANDGALSANDTVTITVSAPDSTSPSVPSNVNAVPYTNGTVALSWSAATDNVGVTAYRIYRDGQQIAQVSGLSHNDTGRVSQAQYSYQISALDQAGNQSALSPAVSVQIPAPPAQGTVVNVRITNGNDDVEEAEDGRMDLASSDLELAYEFGMGNQRVGLRFPGVQIPVGAVITNAWIEFEVDETGSSATSLAIQALAADNVAAFTTAANNLSSRAVTGSLAWNSLPAWNTLDAKQQTPNIASLVQAIVNRPGWAQGNAMGFRITGTGTRTAEAYNGEPAAAPLLHVEYTLGAQVNQAPQINAGADINLVQPNNSVMVSATVSDDGLPANSSITVTWSMQSGPGAVTFSNPHSFAPTATFSVPGTYVLSVVASDGDLTGSDTLVVNLAEADASAPTVPQNLTAVNNVNLGASLNWSASQDNTAVVGYRIYRDGQLLTTTTATSHVDTGLLAGVTHTYQVAARDAAGNTSALSAPATVTIAQAAQSLMIQITNGADDTEEQTNGTIQLNSSDIEIVDEVGFSLQTVGVRFRNVTLPRNATIVSARIEFEVDEASGGVANIAITAENTANPAVYGTSAFNLTSRATLATVVPWQITDAWQVDARHSTPDLTSLVQALVNRADWASGNAMSFVFSGTGSRTVESYEGEATAAPRLYIQYR